MEGGDTWHQDPATNVHEKFNITGTSDGFGDLEHCTCTGFVMLVS